MDALSADMVWLQKVGDSQRYEVAELSLDPERLEGQQRFRRLTLTTDIDAGLDLGDKFRLLAKPAGHPVLTATVISASTVVAKLPWVGIEAEQYLGPAGRG